MFFKYLNSDRQPVVFAPISKVRTPHVPGSDAPSSRIIFQDEHLERTVHRTETHARQSRRATGRGAINESAD
ncbi:MAG: hypothetical protein DME26_09830 [Verrucomicrobia bacterium]|nr:MAG: hypothetical protein DME26_09830 [Verrucomicrobiota bacterium]